MVKKPFVLYVLAKKEQRTPSGSDSELADWSSNAILLVNENAPIKNSLSTLLDICGYEVQIATGKKAVGLVKSWLTHRRDA